MASSNIMRETVGDVTECPICTETMVDPRVLPCIHTFCFKCLDQLWRDKQPGVKVPCPMCRTEVVIPVEVVSGLSKNFFVEKLVGAQKSSNSENVAVMCDICMANEDDVTSESVSEKFCTECQQHLCKRCLKFHRSMNSSKKHQVIPIGSKSTATMAQYLEIDCTLHKGKGIDIYCLECEVAVCTICFITKHNRHECSDIQSVADDLKARIKSNIEETRSIVADAENQSKTLTKLMEGFEVSVKEAQSKIIEAGEKIKQFVDMHVQVLLEELQDVRTKKVKEFETVKEELLIQKLSLESFLKYSETILENAIPTEVASVAKDLSVRFESLKSVKIPHIGNSLEMFFIPHDSQPFSMGGGNTGNILGKVGVHKNIVLSTVTKSVSYETDPKLRTSIKFSNLARGIVAFNQQVYVVVSSSNEVQVFNSSTYAPEPSIPILGLSDPYDIAGNENVLHIGSTNGKIYRIEVRDKSITSWSVGSGSGKVSLSVNIHGHVIATNQSSNSLYEYTSTGELRRKIALKCDSGYLYRAVHMDGDQFLVCQTGGGSVFIEFHRVCLFDNRGNLIKSFGSTEGSGDAKLSYPYRLVVDRNGFILVADYLNRRVVLLNKQLKYVKDIIPASMNMSYIVTLFLDEDNGRLYLSDFYNNKLAIFDLDVRV